MRAERPRDDQTMWHETPVWRGPRNHLIHAPVEGWGGITREQLWTRPLGEDRHELCCLPFLAYDLALGDELVAPGDVFARVVRRSGRGVLRVAVRDGSRDALAAIHRVVPALRGDGVLFERAPGQALLSIDVADAGSERGLVALLEPEVANGLLVWEMATSRRPRGDPPERAEPTEPG